MFCPKCGRMNNDGDTLCKGCGAVLHEPEEEKPIKKNPAKKIVAAIIALAVAAGAAVCVLTQCESAETQSTIEYLVF